jgi:hypothetical protein
VKQRNDDQQMIFGVTVLAGIGLIGLVWHFCARFLIPQPDRLDMLDLLGEHWRYRDNFTNYTGWRWGPMIAAGYPFAFLASVLPSVLVYGCIAAAERRNWISFAHAAIGCVVGGLLGFALMEWSPMPNELLRALTLPALALVIGGVMPFILTPPRDASPVRGTRIVQSRSNCRQIIETAIKTARTAIAGVLLDAAAEVRHFAAIGVTGSGKSAALLGMMYTALSRGDRHIVADPDGGAMRLFFKPGDVILNPDDARSVKWDILAEIKNKTTDYRLLAEALVPFPKDGNNEWILYAQEIFASCLESWHAHGLGGSDAFLAAMATADREKLAALCEGMPAHRYFENGNEKMLGSIMGTLAPSLGNLRPLTQVRGESFSVRQWLRDGRGTLWIPYGATQIPALRSLISCWMGLSIMEALSFPDCDKRRIWFYVDELDALGRIQGLKDALARLRKKGFCVVMGLQSIAQVRAVYGEAEAHTIIENCDNKLILRCGASEGGGTARFASQVIGDREVERDETTTSRTSGRHGSTSTSSAVRVHREAAVMDSEIMRLEPCQGYLKVATQPDWIRVNFKPMDFPVRVQAYVPASGGTEMNG